MLLIEDYMHWPENKKVVHYDIFNNALNYYQVVD